MKIVLLEPLGIPEEVLAQYQARLEAQGHSMVCYGARTTDPAELLRRTGDSDVAILANTPYPASVVEGASQLKLLNVAFTGVDHVALEACRAKGVTVCNAAGYSTQCVAELALGLTIACLRQLPACETAARSGGAGTPFRGREIAGRTVGIGRHRRHWHAHSAAVPGLRRPGYCLFPDPPARGGTPGCDVCFPGGAAAAK